MTDQIKERKIKKRTIQEYERRSKLKLRSKCNVQNKMIINLWVVAVVRYKIRIIIKWRDEELGILNRSALQINIIALPVTINRKIENPPVKLDFRRSQ